MTNLYLIVVAIWASLVVVPICFPSLLRWSAGLDWWKRRRLLRRIRNPPAGKRWCHTCDKHVPETAVCDYDWSGNCSAADFNVMRDRGVPETIGGVMSKTARMFGIRW